MLRFKFSNKKTQDVITLALKITQPCECDFKFVYYDGEKSNLTAPQRCIDPQVKLKSHTRTHNASAFLSLSLQECRNESLPSKRNEL